MVVDYSYCCCGYVGALARAGSTVEPRYLSRCFETWLERLLPHWSPEATKAHRENHERQLLTATDYGLDLPFKINKLVIKKELKIHI